MVITARETRVILFLVTLFSLGLYLVSRNTNLKPILHVSRPTLALDNNTQPINASPRLVWDKNKAPETVVLLHKVPGLTVFKNLYIFNGTIYIVTTQPEKVPEKRRMLSNGLPLNAELKQANEPTDRTLSIITPREAQLLFGHTASVMDGVSFIQTDASQFLGHMYHFIVEVFALWHWRCFTSPDLDPVFGPTRPYPKRYIFPHASRELWQDRAGMNLWTIRAAFGGISLEFQNDWDFRMQLRRPFILETVVLGDRAAWHRVPSWKSPKIEFPLVVRGHWWEPIRKLVTAFADPPGEVIDAALVERRPLITYISRQKTGRRLKSRDHRNLVSELQLLCEVIECEVHVATMEDLDKAEQIQILSRTTILVGVHGNGLSGQLWLKPTPRTTVIEIFQPGGFLYDYEYTARSLGHRHYGIWYDKYFTAPDLPDDRASDGFHGSSISVNGTAVAALIHRRLTLKDPSDA